MSSISRRRMGLMAFSVIGGSCLGSGLRPLNLKTGRLFPATPETPPLATNYRESGLVLRRVSPVAVRHGEGSLTEPTAATQPWWRLPLFMPLCGPRCSPRRSLAAGDPVIQMHVDRSVAD